MLSRLWFFFRTAGASTVRIVEHLELANAGNVLVSTIKSTLDEYGFHLAKADVVLWVIFPLAIVLLMWKVLKLESALKTSRKTRPKSTLTLPQSNTTLTSLRVVLSDELAYFRAIIDRFNLAKSGSVITVVVSPLRAGRLVPAAGNSLETLAGIVRTRRLLVTYYFMVDKQAFFRVPKYDRDRFFARYEFAKVCMIWMNASVKARYELPNKADRNIVLFETEHVGYTHGRDNQENFTDAYMHLGPSYERLLQLVNRLKLLGSLPKKIHRSKKK